MKYWEYLKAWAETIMFWALVALLVGIICFVFFLVFSDPSIPTPTGDY